MTLELRPYQNDAVYEVCQKWHRHARVLISMPCGSGKTAVGAYLADAWCNHDLASNYKLPARVLWLAHRDELIDQAAEACEDWMGEPVAVEKGERSIVKSPKLMGSSVVVSSIQTMLRPNRREFFSPDDFGMIFVDEAHHVICESWQTVLDYFQPAKILGATATTDRADEVPLGKFFDDVAYHYELIDAIQDGWLAPIKQQFVRVDDLDWSSVRKTGSGDLSAEDLDAVIGQEEAIHKIVSPIAPMIGDRQTLIFTPSVRVAEMVAEVMARYCKGGAQCVSAKTPEDERRAIAEAFRRREFQVAVNCGVYLEGTDFPAVSCIVIARPTLSRMLHAQMIGRGLRGGPLAPVEGKSDCLVIDLVGSSMKHKLQSTADLLGGKLDSVVRDECRARVFEAAGDKPADVLEEVLACQARADEIRAADRARIIAEAKATRKTVDPFCVFGDAVGLSESESPGWWKNLPPDDEQKARLKQIGIPDKGLTYNQARQLIGEAARRSRGKLSTYKQARMLKARGFDPSMTLAEASDVMTHIATRPGGWNFQSEDGRRRAMAKRRGRLFRFGDLELEYTVAKGVECRIRREGQDWLPYETAHESKFHEVAERTDEGAIFRRGGYDLAVQCKMYAVKVLAWR
jgi:superfamily II DNA or RNA helicase